MIRTVKDLGQRARVLFWKLRGLSHHLWPLVAIIVAVALLGIFIPVGDALWSKILGITGEVRIGQFTPTPTKRWGGCSPGFWKQVHHFGFWPERMGPSTTIMSIFGFSRDFSTELNLLEALEDGGGGGRALRRQAVAAILNAQHVDVDYPYTPQQVVEMFAAAYAKEDFESMKNLFETANEVGCPLSRDMLTDTPTATTTSTPTSTDTATSTPTSTATETPTSTPTETPTSTKVKKSPATSTPTATATDTPSATTTDTPTASATPTSTPMLEPTDTDTPTTTSTPTETPSPTATPTETFTPTDTPTATETVTPEE